MAPTIPFSTIDRECMSAALEHAKSISGREVPIAALLVADGERFFGENSPITSHDPTAHAEIAAIRRAAAHFGNYRLPGSTLYTTLEPCAMCAGAIVHARIERVVIALEDPKSGAAGSVLDVIPNARLNHRPRIEFGLLADESRSLLQNFFESRRRKEVA